MEELEKFTAEYAAFEDFHWLTYRVYVELQKLGWSQVHAELVPAAVDDRYCVCGTRPKDSIQTLVIPVQLHEMASLDRCLKIHDAIAAETHGRTMLALVSDDTIILENIQAGLHFEFCDMKKSTKKRRGGKAGERERQRAKLLEGKAAEEDRSQNAAEEGKENEETSDTQELVALSHR